MKIDINSVRKFWTHTVFLTVFVTQFLSHMSLLTMDIVGCLLNYISGDPEKIEMPDSVLIKSIGIVAFNLDGRYRRLGPTNPAVVPDLGTITACCPEH